MEYIIYIVVIIVVVFLIKKALFSKEKETLIIEDEPIENIVEPEPVQVVKKVKEYQLNASAIKLYLYPDSTFNDYKTRKIYNHIVIENCWINEPFHSSLVQILYFIDVNDLWIKSPFSRDMILNFRDAVKTEKKNLSFNVFDLEDVIYSIVIEIIKQTKTLSDKVYIQKILIKSILIIISKSNIEVKKNKDISITIETIIDKYFYDLSYNLIEVIGVLDDENYGDILKLYEQNIRHIQEHPYTTGIGNDELKLIKSQLQLPKKELLSIKSTLNFV